MLIANINLFICNLHEARSIITVMTKYLLCLRKEKKIHMKKTGRFESEKIT